MRFFDEIKTLDELKKHYKTLCKKFHPDVTGGEGETIKQVNIQYEESLKRVLNHKGEKLSLEDLDIEMELKGIILKTISLQGIAIELCGRWIWFTGSTAIHKTFLKDIGCFWARKKLAWYWRPANAKTFSKYRMSLGEIRLKYGSKSFGKMEALRIA